MRHSLIIMVLFTLSFCLQAAYSLDNNDDPVSDTDTDKGVLIIELDNMSLAGKTHEVYIEVNGERADKMTFGQSKELLLEQGDSTLRIINTTITPSIFNSKKIDINITANKTTKVKGHFKKAEFISLAVLVPIGVFFTNFYSISVVE